MPQKDILIRRHEMEPALLDKGLANPDKYGYISPTFEKRTAILDVGETKRPW